MHPQPQRAQDDAALVAAVRTSPRSFEQLVRRYNQRLYRIARAQLGDDHEAEDATQQAWVSIYAALSQWTGRGSFSGWAATIVINTCRQRRRHVTESLDDDDADALETGLPAPDEETHRAEVRHVLQRTVDTLPPALRAVFVMRDVEGLDSAETAAALGIAEGLVRVRLHRARRALETSLDAQFAGEGRALYAFMGARCDGLTARVLAALALDLSS